MNMAQSAVCVSDISERLAGHISALADMTRSVNDGTSTYILNHLEPRFRQGLVRVAVIGVTGSGKSTAVNALVEHLALPENPSVSTPIPVWLGYHGNDTDMAEIYLSEEGRIRKTTCDMPTFRRKYCYNMNDILDKDRRRYNNVEFGALKMNAPLLRNSVALIDTLGISATSVDSRKTIRVLEEGVDAVLFVTKNSKLTISEMKFLYQYVLCCRSRTDGELMEIRPEGIRPENLIFVNNLFYGVPDRVEFAARIREFYRNSGLDLPEQRIEDCVARNIFYINAHQARMGRIGAYPYGQSAPEGSTGQVIAGLQKMEAGEREKLVNANPAELVEQSGILPLSEAVRAKCRELCFGENAVSVRRIQEIKTIIDGILQTANTRLAQQHLTVAELQNKRNLFSDLEQDDIKEQSQITAAMSRFNLEYQQSFRKLLGAITDELKTDCAGRARRKTMPPSLKTQYSAYKQMGKSEREQYLAALLPEDIKETYEYCSEQMIRALDERQTCNFKTPFAVMEEVRSYIHEQETLFEARIQSLKAAGGEELGMFFPESIVVKELFSRLELDLTEKVKEIIADACISGGKEFEEQVLTRCIKHCSLNLFQDLAGMVFQEAAPKWLWNRIKEKLFVPLAEYIVTELPSHTFENIRIKTEEAFNATQNEICRSHIELFVSLKITLAQLQKQITDADEAAENTRADMDRLKQICEEIETDILRMQHQLQNG